MWFVNACFLLQTTKLSQAGESDSGNIQTIQTQPTKAGATNAKSSSRLTWRLFTCAAAFAAPRTRYLTLSVNIGVRCAAHTKPAAAIVARGKKKQKDWLFYIPGLPRSVDRSREEARVVRLGDLRIREPPGREVMAWPNGTAVPSMLKGKGKFQFVHRHRHRCHLHTSPFQTGQEVNFWDLSSAHSLIHYR